MIWGGPLQKNHTKLHRKLPVPLLGRGEVWRVSRPDLGSSDPLLVKVKEKHWDNALLLSCHQSPRGPCL